jgi:hypothetical protein
VVQLKMKTLSPVLSLLVLASCALAQTTASRSFEDKLYSIAQLRHFSLGDQRLAALSESDKANVLQCRAVLVELFRSLEKKSAVSQYLTPELAGKYKTPDALAAALTDPETSVLAIGVSDFTLEGDGQIRLQFFGIADSEGAITASEMFATLRRAGSSWQISGFAPLSGH